MCKHCTCSNSAKEEITNFKGYEATDSYAFAWQANWKEVRERTEEYYAEVAAGKFKGEHPDIANIWLNKSKKGYFTTIKLRDGRKATVRKSDEDRHSWREAMWWCYVKVLKINSYVMNHQWFHNLQCADEDIVVKR